MIGIDLILFFCIGAIFAIIIDTIWWKVNYKRIEKGVEVLEHYHMGLALLIIGILASIYYIPVSAMLIGMGLFFVVGEWHQSVEIKNKKVVPGHPFAYGSAHFKKSSVIGIILAALIPVSYYFVDIL